MITTNNVSFFEHKKTQRLSINKAAKEKIKLLGLTRKEAFKEAKRCKITIEGFVKVSDYLARSS